MNIRIYSFHKYVLFVIASVPVTVGFAYLYNGESGKKMHSSDFHFITTNRLNEFIGKCLIHELNMSLGIQQFLLSYYIFFQSLACIPK